MTTTQRMVGVLLLVLALGIATAALWSQPSREDLLRACIVEHQDLDLSDMIAVCG